MTFTKLETGMLMQVQNMVLLNKFMAKCQVILDISISTSKDMCAGSPLKEKKMKLLHTNAVKSCSCNA